jgi:hypothetical protein
MKYPGIDAAGGRWALKEKFRVPLLYPPTKKSLAHNFVDRQNDWWSASLRRIGIEPKTAGTALAFRRAHSLRSASAEARMPRPSLPRLLPHPKVADSFHLDASAKRDIANIVGLKELSERTVESIDLAVNCYRATIRGSKDTTVANTRFALRQLKKRGRAREDALNLFADDRAAVDYTTHNIMQPLAKAVLDGRPGSNDALAQAARNRITELVDHPRVATSTESLRLFCGILSKIFFHVKGEIPEDEAQRRCRRFALEIFTVAGIDHADFDAHPERLTEYLGTDVSAN